MKENIQPDWLKAYAKGSNISSLYEVYLEDKNYAIIKCPGHSYTGLSSSLYASVKYTLIKKDGKNYWSAFRKKVHIGRVKKEDKIKLQAILKDYEEKELNNDIK